MSSLNRSASNFGSWPVPRSAARRREPRAGDPRPRLEVEDAELLADLPVRLRLKRERRLGPRGEEHRVVGLARSDGDARVRRVRDVEQSLLARGLEGGELGLAFLDRGRQRLELLACGGELVRLLVELGHPLVRGVARAALGVELGLELLAAVVE